MNKKIITITSVFLALSLALSLAGVQSAFSQNGDGAEIKKELRLNMRSAEVTELQKKLAEKGLFKVTATGFFGPITQKAVKDFQKQKGLTETGLVDEQTASALNDDAGEMPEANQAPNDNSGQGNAENRNINVDNSGQGNAADRSEVQALKETIVKLQAQIKDLQDQLAKAQAASAPAAAAEQPKAAAPEAQAKNVTTEAQAKAGIIITGGVSGPGYPTGPLNLVVPATSLLFDRAGTVKQDAANLQLSDRQYEAPLETIPPTMGAFPITINGVANTATQLKVITNLKTKAGVGQHQGTIDVDIDTLPAGHLTLNYSGTATVTGTAATGLTTVSKGTFKSSKATGIFTGLVAEGNYDMTIVESGIAVGSPVSVTITTVTP